MGLHWMTLTANVLIRASPNDLHLPGGGVRGDVVIIALRLHLMQKLIDYFSSADPGAQL